MLSAEESSFSRMQGANAEGSQDTTADCEQTIQLSDTQLETIVPLGAQRLSLHAPFDISALHHCTIHTHNHQWRWEHSYNLFCSFQM